MEPHLGKMTMQLRKYPLNELHVCLFLLTPPLYHDDLSSKLLNTVFDIVCIYCRYIIYTVGEYSDDEQWYINDNIWHLHLLPIP